MKEVRGELEVNLLIDIKPSFPLRCFSRQHTGPDCRLKDTLEGKLKARSHGAFLLYSIEASQLSSTRRFSGTR